MTAEEQEVSLHFEEVVDESSISPVKERPARGPARGGRKTPGRTKSMEDYGSLAVMRRKAKSDDGNGRNTDRKEEDKEDGEGEQENARPKRRGGRRKVPARTKSCDDMASMKIMRQKSREETRKEHQERRKEPTELIPTE